MQKIVLSIVMIIILSLLGGSWDKIKCALKIAKDWETWKH